MYLSASESAVIIHIYDNKVWITAVKNKIYLRNECYDGFTNKTEAEKSSL